ncbi:hypothetical protein P154DRAFT_222290 [Amniculicola lignicola CBS 123094]|uniref:Protein kinase domain-containing protein n=1 Tax=Amniculicola lignicola CBS 123094 TaxID=1392246 RepID=A0A6A5X278_9PLEO|nr:hypothetical protein P154DRAFT_222290 [Amniculicola lignicola CBS 123094]
MEMADKGNLREMQTQLNELRENYPSTPAHLPELFIWMVFRNITWACDTLRSEYREEENVFVHADTVNDIVHAEIKPANILIKRKDPPEISETLKKQMKSRGQRQNQFPFGVPVLGDLEKYYRLWSNLSSERLVATSGAPGGFSAPEEAGPFPHTPVAIDVFQIGATIWSLMRNEPYGLRDVGGGILQQGQMIPYRNMDEMLARHDNDLKYDRLYSQRLENLVSSCLKEDLRKRIEIDDLSLAVEHGYWAVVRHNAGLLETPESELPDYMRIPFYMSANGAFALGRTLGPEAERSEVVRVSSRVGQDEEDAVDLYLDGDGDDMPWGRY